jgi:hypothetical protein
VSTFQLTQAPLVALLAAVAAAVAVVPGWVFHVTTRSASEAPLRVSY